MSFARWIEDCLLRLAAITSVEGEVTRLAFTPEMRRANETVLGWMEEAGMAARIDGAGNVVGRYESEPPGAAALMLGSHLDTVGDAGRYDGILGVVTAIACVGDLHRRARRFPFAIEVVGFCDEEAFRFGASIGGSRALAGLFDPASLSLRDGGGMLARDAITAFGLTPDSLAGAARKADDILAYLELHIEQGPVLEAESAPLGCVTSIAGASRLEVTVRGTAGHAGTVPMHLRRDPLAAAAALMIVLETACRKAGDVVGTVGAMNVMPGSSNVVPGHVRFPIDIRSGTDESRLAVLALVRSEFDRIARERGVVVAITTVSERPVIRCASWLMTQIENAILSVGTTPVDLPSGAGHDGISIVALAEIGMIFVRCRDGVSHNPAEAAAPGDIELGARALLSLIEHFSPDRRREADPRA